MRSIVALAVLSALALTLAGCTLLEGYESPRDEVCDNDRDDDFDGLIDCDDVASCRGQPHCLERNGCANRHDDDRDGLSDCADPDCDGQCSEGEITACGNGRDDDGDGHVDYADPQCWPFGVIEITRCPDVAGTDTTIPGRIGPWRPGDTIHLPVPEDVPDPDDPTHHVLGLTAAGDASARTVDPLPGLWDGTHLALRARLDANTRFGLWLGPDGNDAIEVIIDGWMQQIIVSAADGFGTTPGVVGAGWWSLAVDVTLRGGLLLVHAVATPDGGAPLDRRTSANVTWAPSADVGLTVFLQGGSTGRVLLGDTSVMRPSGRVCEDTRPSMEGLVAGIARSPSSACGLGLSPVLGQAAWAFDATTQSVMAASWPSYQMTGIPSVVPAWDASRGNFRGVISLHDGTLSLQESADCLRWTELGNALGSFPISPLSWGYAVRPAIGSRPGFHELWAANGSHIQFATSDTGNPGSFVLGRAARVPAGDIGFGSVRVTTVGNDHVYTVPRVEEIEPGRSETVTRLYVESGAAGGSLLDLPGARLAPGADEVLLFESDAPRGRFQAELLLGSAALRTEFARMSVRAPALCEVPMPELCNGRDDDCDGVADEVDPDASASCPAAHPPFTQARCGAVVVGGVEHFVDPAQRGCVESYDAIPTSATCDPGYAMCAPSSCDASVECQLVVCAQTGCP